MPQTNYEQASGNEILGSIVQKHRQLARKSIRQVAREAGLHHAFVARIEDGSRGMSVDSLARLSESFGTAFLFEYLQTVLNIINASHRVDPLKHRPSVAAREQQIQG